ncbi:MAG: hypothetical protein RIM99_13495 [Cyclobacteriaceae bacterium]
MNQFQIISLYRLFAIMTLVIGTAIIIIPGELHLTDKLWIALSLNLSFHIVYQFISRAPIGLLEQIQNDKPAIKKVAHKLLKGFSILFILAPIPASILLLISIVSEDEYESLVVLLIFFALFLGGYQSKLKLDENK